jgi:hypothetical protein
MRDGHPCRVAVDRRPRHARPRQEEGGAPERGLRLQKKRCNDFVLLERSSELGGTWQVNLYGGAEVDVPTSLYCISFIPYRFSKTFAPQSELLGVR